MKYVCHLKHLSNEQLRARRAALLHALDRAHESSVSAVRRERRNIQRRLWRVEEECDKRNMKFSIFSSGPAALTD